MPDQTTITVLIPAYNEAECIGATVTAVRGIKDVTEIVVIDDGSQDDTAAQAEAAGADVTLRIPHAGKGAALQAGFAVSRGEILLLLDADLGETAAEAPVLLIPLQMDRAEMTIATFPVIPGKGGGVGLVVRLARSGIQMLTGRVMQAPLSGQRALRRSTIDKLGGFDSGWGVEIALTVQALRAGFRVEEIPTTMTHRVTGRSTQAILHRAVQFVSALRVLLSLALHSSPRTGRGT